MRNFYFPQKTTIKVNIVVLNNSGILEPGLFSFPIPQSVILVLDMKDIS